MSAYINPIDSLLVECIKDIRWEIHQVRARIQQDEVYRLAEALLYRKPVDWPFALLELQRGITITRLLNHLNFHVRKFGLSSAAELAVKGPFPAFSLKSLQAKVGEHNAVLRTASCIEALGNKAWDCALKPIKTNVFPVKIEVATLALKACGYSFKQQAEVAMADLVKCIKGEIINFLGDWERLLIQQTQAWLSVYRSKIYVSISEAAV